MASYPTYQPSIFVGHKDHKKLAPLLDPKAADAANNPGINRAIDAAYPPGSTFKPVTALAAMQEHLVTPTEQLACTPVYTATARGASIGRKEAAVANRRRRSADATPSADGVSDNWTSTVPATDRDRISNPESRKTSRIAAFPASVVAWNRSEAVVSRAGGQPFEEERADPFALKAIVDGERDFRSSVRQPDV